jgi:hypothetical protein
MSAAAPTVRPAPRWSRSSIHNQIVKQPTPWRAAENRIHASAKLAAGGQSELKSNYCTDYHKKRSRELTASAQLRNRPAVATNGVLRVLMGDKVEPRREFIEKHALEVRNLDV